MSDWIVPYINFNGNCEEAVTFYQKAFGGELQIMRYGDAPPNPGFPMSDEIKNRVMHAELKKDGHIIRFSDTMPQTPASAGTNISFSINFDTKEETQAMFEALSAGGTVGVAPEETFFSPWYASFTDKFGIIWQLVCRPK